MSLKDIIIKNNFTFSKRFGQNFISDDDLLSSIVEKSEIEDKTVVEIGAGGGTLTKALSSKANRVFAYEIDARLKPVLSETLKDITNVELIFKDFLKEKTSDFEKKIGGKYSVVANIPYYVTTPIIMRFIEEAENCEKIVVMVQKEVADRLCALPNTPDYGSITAAIDLCGDSEIIGYVDRKMFYPVPNVDSAVVKIVINNKKNEGVDRVAFRSVLRSAFQSRRKTLANNLISSFKLDRETAEGVIEECGIEKNARGETLSAKDIVKLSELMKEKGLLSSQTSNKSNKS